jgi:hypothetical protein
MVGLNSCPVLHHAKVGDQTAGKHLEKIANIMAFLELKILNLIS